MKSSEGTVNTREGIESQVQHDGEAWVRQWWIDFCSRLRHYIGNGTLNNGLSSRDSKYGLAIGAVQCSHLSSTFQIQSSSRHGLLDLQHPQKAQEARAHVQRAKIT